MSSSNSWVIQSVSGTKGYLARFDYGDGYGDGDGDGDICMVEKAREWSVVCSCIGSD
jgi:hypothetical protein